MILLRSKLSGVTGKALEAFAASAQKAVKLRGEISVLVTSSNEIQKLNRDFRHKNKPTDVLSFPSEATGLAGDIAISAEIAKENAQRLRHSALTELKILILHGILHLAGHDHESDNGEMATLEAKLRAKFELPLGLIARTHEAVAPAKKAAAKSAAKGTKKTVRKSAAVKPARAAQRSPESKR
jgi:probable rRNA maturation factor